MSVSSTGSRFSSDEEIDSHYRALSGKAVAGLLLGGASALAFAHAVAWIVPVGAVAMNVAALREIAAAGGRLAGRGLAIAGLVLSLILGLGAISSDLTENYILRAEGDRFAGAFFDYLRRGEPEKSYLFTVETPFRPLLSDEKKLWAEYEKFPMHQEGVRAFVTLPEIRAVLSLGERAKVRPYRTLRRQDFRNGSNQPSTALFRTYAVTYDEEGQRKSFFVTMTLERNQFRSGYEWRLSAHTLGVREPD